MKKTIIIILLSAPLSLFAQQAPNSSFAANAGFNAEAYDITWTMPRNMADLDTTIKKAVRRGRQEINDYAPVLESKNHEFVLMYLSPIVFINNPDPLHPETGIKNIPQYAKVSSEILTNDNWARHFIADELKVAFNYVDNVFRLFEPKKDTVLRFADYVATVSGKKARRWFDADSVFTYTLPVDDPFKKYYTHCTGMIITRKDRAGIGLKLYFTDQGKKNEGKYLRSLRRKIRYRNDDWQYDRDVVKQATQKHYGKEAPKE